MNYKLIITGFLCLALGLTAGTFFIGAGKTKKEKGKKQQAKGSDSHDDHDHGEAAVWTCSMHPQIRLNEPGDCPICGMDLIEAASGGGSMALQMTPEAVKLAQIQTTRVRSGESSSGSIAVNGKISSDETLAASLVAHLPGRIERLYVRYTGQPVYNGQKIARVYAPDLITAQRELIEANKAEEMSPGLLEAAKSKLRYWKIRESTIDEILETGEVREQFDIYAEHSGVVNKRRVSVGDYLKKGSVLFDVQNLNKLWVLFEVYERDLSAVQVGDQIEFTTTTYGETPYYARVTFIDPLVDPKTRITLVRAEISNRHGDLKPDMFVRGTLVTKRTTDKRLFIPRSAVLWTGQRSVVYVKQKKAKVPSFEYREVILGDLRGEDYEILDGLRYGELVVTNGAFLIDASAQLNNQASMMNQLVTVQSGHDHTHLPSFEDQVPSKFKDQFEDGLESYLKIKDALVNSDPEATKQGAKSLMASLTKDLDMSLLRGQAHLYWMQKQKMLKELTGELVTATTVEAQREVFDPLSSQLIEVIRVIGVHDGSYYIQHCPMAFDDTGADWISDKKAIRNPYFGDAMLKCGSVEETISPKERKQKSAEGPQGHQH